MGNSQYYKIPISNLTKSDGKAESERKKNLEVDVLHGGAVFWKQCSISRASYSTTTPLGKRCCMVYRVTGPKISCLDSMAGLGLGTRPAFVPNKGPGFGLGTRPRYHLVWSYFCLVKLKHQQSHNYDKNY